MDQTNSVNVQFVLQSSFSLLADRICIVSSINPMVAMCLSSSQCPADKWVIILKAFLLWAKKLAVSLAERFLRNIYAYLWLISPPDLFSPRIRGPPAPNLSQLPSCQLSHSLIIIISYHPQKGFDRRERTCVQSQASLDLILALIVFNAAWLSE